MSSDIKVFMLNMQRRRKWKHHFIYWKMKNYASVYAFETLTFKRFQQ